MDYVFFLQQHIGKASSPIVKAGDEVLRGQKIAVKPSGSLGANLFSSISGKVVSVDEEKIVIEENNTDFSTFVPLESTDARELIEESGLVGLGGAGFPTYAKLNLDLKGNGYAIVNAAECEPILSYNIRRIEEEPEKLPSAANAVVINCESVYRLREAVEDKKPLIDKDMTVAGKLKENGTIHTLFDVPIGIKVANVIDKVGGLGDEYGELIMGGPFTGKRTSLEMQVANLIPSSGTATGLHGYKLVIGVIVNFILGALMTAGVGLYAPCMALVSLFGMSPMIAFPIMMGSSAYLMPIASIKFIKEGAYNRKASLAIALFGILGVFVGHRFITKLNLESLKFIIVLVMAYSAISLFYVAYKEEKMKKAAVSN